MPDRDDVVLSLPPEVLRRYDARVLDPGTASRPRGRPGPPTSTAYLGGRLLVAGLLGVSALGRIGQLEEVLQESGYDVRLRPDRLDEVLGRWLMTAFDGQPFLDPKEAEELESRPLGPREEITRLSVERELGPISVRALDGGAQTRVFVQAKAVDGAPDPWDLVVAARAAGLDFVDLEHLVIPAPGGMYWGGQGPGFYWGGQGPGFYWGGQGPGFYWGGQGDSGCAAVPGRTPVSLPLPDPAEHVDLQRVKRRPVVVVPDTGIGDHPWFGRGSGVAEHRSLGGWPILPGGEPSPRPEERGVRDDLTGTLDALSGHGTFIAGIVRQLAPAAQVVGLPVLDSAGLAAEDDVVRTLVQVLVLHVLAQSRGVPDFGDDGGAVDVLSLSLGFYHQDGDVGAHPVRSLLQLFSDSGVLVVAAAGNQGTRVPLYPAGWAVGSLADAEGDGPPLVSVGAANPDGRTVALFSNSGPWVTTHRRGVNVVSTLPVTFDGSAGSRWSTTVDGQVRCTPDPDDHSGGFAVWSGTSFAAPWLVGQLAARLTQERSLPAVDRPAMRERARSVLGAELGSG